MSQYTRLNVIEVGQLNYVDFLKYKRDAFITRCRTTEAGREYLANAWRLEQTAPDRAKLRKKLKKGGATRG